LNAGLIKGIGPIKSMAINVSIAQRGGTTWAANGR